MKVNFVNYSRGYQAVREEVLNGIDEALSRGDVYLRGDVVELEERIKKKCKVKECITTNSCTDSLFLSLYALDLPPKSEVITVGHTYISTIAAIVHNNLSPKLVDIGQDHNMDTEKMRAAISKKTSAIIPVHLNGRMCEMDVIAEIAEEEGIAIVEDCAQSITAEYGGKKAGVWGETGCFSFYPAKVLGAYGDAGCITTNNVDLAERLYLLRDNGEKPKYRMSAQDLLKREIGLFGFNSVLDNIQAIILNIKIQKLEKAIGRRRAIAKRYCKEFKSVDLILPPIDGEKRYDVFQNYVVQCNGTKERDSLEMYLKKQGVETLVSWRIPNHKQKSLGIKAQLPNTEKISSSVLSLPMYPELSDQEVDYVCEKVLEWSKKC